jgi:hypothetical protein
MINSINSVNYWYYKSLAASSWKYSSDLDERIKKYPDNAQLIRLRAEAEKRYLTFVEKMQDIEESRIENDEFIKDLKVFDEFCRNATLEELKESEMEIKKRIAEQQEFMKFLDSYLKDLKK